MNFISRDLVRERKIEKSGAMLAAFISTSFLSLFFCSYFVEQVDCKTGRVSFGGRQIALERSFLRLVF